MSDPSATTPIGFIGGGNMASSLIGGLLQGGHEPEAITVIDPSAEQRARLQSDFGIHIAADSGDLGHLDAVVLAVKPHIVEAACAAMAATLREDAVVISVAAGTLSANIDGWLGGGRRVVRCMPNTPALYSTGASVLFAGGAVDDSQRQLATYILAAGGKTWWVESEPELDAVTALSGSGPAYGFLLIEAMTDAGQQLGLDAQLAAELAVQTLLGAATMAQQDTRDAASLREGVTSKGGTTAAALAVFDAGDFRGLVETAMTAARDRARELAEPTGDSTL